MDPEGPRPATITLDFSCQDPGLILFQRLKAIPMESCTIMHYYAIMNIAFIRF